MPLLPFVRSLFRSKLQNILHTETTEANIIEHFLIFSQQACAPADGETDDFQPHPDALPSGEYSVGGTNPWDSASQYFGSLSVSADGPACKGVWRIGFTAAGHHGKGIFAHGYLCLNFTYWDQGMPFSGKVIYAVQRERLNGLWFEKGSKLCGRELCGRK